MSKETIERIGEVIQGEAGRDAIHFAVVPLTAGQILVPGEHVGFLDETKETVGRSEEHIGIVDPFLTENVKPGWRIWVFLYPKSITGLRHVWSHPAFPEEGAAKQVDKQKSEQWLRTFIAANVPFDYEEFLAMLTGAPRDYYRPPDYHQGIDWEGDTIVFLGQAGGGVIPDEFWDHYEIVTGKKPKYRSQYFSCSC